MNTTPPNSHSGLQQKEVAFTGRLASMTQEQAQCLVLDQGGRVVDRPTHSTDYLVVGQAGWPLRKDGGLTEKLLTAQRLHSEGVSLQVLSEEQFLQLAGRAEQAEDVHRLYTVEQLTRILGVRASQLRRWKTLGLIQPAMTRYRLEYFDFEQVANARCVMELMQQGVTPKRIQESLASLQRVVPAANLAMVHLDAPSGRSQLLFRLPEGELADASGQLHFDFSRDDEDEQETIALTVPPQSVQDWFQAGVELEEQGQLQAAADAYSEALLRGGPDPLCCFNLANVLYALDEKPRAAERYRQAVELDPSYIEAWNNLGNTLADLDQPSLAIAAYEQALAIDPTYPDAHYNLAATLEQLGQLVKARQHWLEYLRYDPSSSWASEIRERLRARS